MKTIEAASVACLALILAAGCGESQPTTHPAKGRLTSRGKPAAGAVVTLLPADGRQLKAYPRGEVGPDGAYTLSTFGKGDGAPAGEYKLTVRWPAAIGKARTPDEIERAVGGDGPSDRLGGRYADPAKSAWAVTVRPGDNALDPIDLPAP